MATLFINDVSMALILSHFVIGVLKLSLSTISRLDLGTVPTVGTTKAKGLKQYCQNRLKPPVHARRES